MKRQTFPIEIITPCFCAGAEPSKAEIRAPSIRGQLRWWFRLIDHNRHHEAEIFGAVAGDEDSEAAALTVRVKDFRSSGAWEMPTIKQTTAENYVWHYVSVSGANHRGRTGPRWNSQGAIAPRSTFTLELLWRRKIAPELEVSFDLALKAFLSLGTLGLRSTRGLGAMHSEKIPDPKAIESELVKRGFVLRWREKEEGFSSYEAALRDYAAWLRYDFRRTYKHDKPSPLGSSSPRQSSALRFRCFKRSDGKFGWLAYEAPHSRVLEERSRSSEPLLKNKRFSGPSPSAP